MKEVWDVLPASPIRFVEKNSKSHTNSEITTGALTMESLKQEAINVISKLPDSADIDDIMYRLYVIDKAQKGRAEAKAGKLVSIEDLEKEIEAW